jgi:hypothetical protein
MAVKNYEVRASLKTNQGTMSNVLLGEAEIDENKLSGNRDAFLKPFARSHFAGEIGKYHGELISVSVIERPAHQDKPSREQQPLSPRKKKAGRVFLGLGLILFVWMGHYVIDSLKSAYWFAPKKAWQWFTGFINA